METVDVLRYDEGIGQPGNRKMRRIGLRTADQRPPPLVPLPDQKRVVCERLRRCQILRPVVAPEAALTAKRRNAAVGRDAGAGEDDRTPRPFLVNGGDRRPQFLHEPRIPRLEERSTGSG